MTEQLIGLRVVQEQILDIEGWVGLRPLSLIDHPNRMMNHRQGFETQEIELHQADFFHIGHRILGHDFVVGPFIERHMIRERFLRNDDAGRMCRGMARQSFERTRDPHEFVDSRVGVD